MDFGTGVVVFFFCWRRRWTSGTGHVHHAVGLCLCRVMSGSVMLCLRLCIVSRVPYAASLGLVLMYLGCDLNLIRGMHGWLGTFCIL